MKQLGVRRLGAAIVGATVLAATATACTVPPSPTITWGFTNLPLAAPAPGVFAGDNASLTYTASNVPAGGQILLQKAGISNGALKWSNIEPLNRVHVGVATLPRPPLGRNTYRLAVTDAKGKLVASANHTLDVYDEFTFSQLTDRQEHTVLIPLGGGGTFPFKYVFQAEIFIEHTSCRMLNEVQLYTNGNLGRTLRVSDTVAGKTKVEDLLADANGSISSITGHPLTIGEDLDLLVLDNNTLGDTAYGNGKATCFTDTGEF